MRLTGFAAIEYAEQEGLLLNKLADNIDEAARGLTVAEAEAIADDRPDLIWLDVPADDYHARRNMEPGTSGKGQPRRAGQRRDELSPTENSGERSRDRGAAGTPGGGLAAGGLAGTTTSSGIPESDELEQAMSGGDRDHSGDRDDTEEPQSGRGGGAVGGTPTFKRVSRQ
jgi:hypothetical protein